MVIALTNMSRLAHGDLPRAVTHAALGRDQIPAAAPITAQFAIWSAVCAPLGILLLLYKTGVHLLSSDQLKRPRVRLLNLGFTTVLVAATYVI